MWSPLRTFASPGTWLPADILYIASKAAGQCCSITSYARFPWSAETPADRDYEGGFAAALMLKDLRLAMEAAKGADAYTPMGAQAEELYTRFGKLGGDGRDFSAIIKMIDDSWESSEEPRRPPSY